MQEHSNCNKKIQLYGINYTCTDLKKTLIW